MADATQDRVMNEAVVNVMKAACASSSGLAEMVMGEAVAKLSGRLCVIVVVVADIPAAPNVIHLNGSEPTSRYLSIGATEPLEPTMVVELLDQAKESVHKHIQRIAVAPPLGEQH